MMNSNTVDMLDKVMSEKHRCQILHHMAATVQQGQMKFNT